MTQAADWRSGPRWSILSVLCPVHPFPLRGKRENRWHWILCHIWHRQPIP